MSGTAVRALVLAGALGLAALGGGAGGREAGCAGNAEGTEREELAHALDAALARGGAWLLDGRGADGTWRSARYRALADGWSATLPALKALAYLPDVDARAALADGVGRLVEAAERGDLAAEGIAYPVYTASLAVLTLARADDPRAAAARDAWLAHLARHQFAAASGWDAAHPSLGGFGGGPLPPRPDGLFVVDADLSSTLFALGALRAAGVPADDPRVRAARGFVERCQNLPLDGTEASGLDDGLDDGGFFLSPSDAARNKAGTAGIDGRGRLRGRSYASATADGLRALLACGAAPDDPRVVRAAAWLERAFDPERNGGDFPAERATERAASYHYASWSAAHAFARLEGAGVAVRAGWARELALALLARQRADGSFAGDAGILLEDDPLVATPLALGALASCRLALLAPEERVEEPAAGHCPLARAAAAVAFGGLGDFGGFSGRAAPRSRRP